MSVDPALELHGVEVETGSPLDCEDPERSLACALGWGSVASGVTLHLIGLVPFVRHVRSWLPAPVRAEVLA